MKTLACLVLAISGLAGPVVSFAQSTDPVTRDQVRADLIRVEDAGYHVGDGDNTTYPAQIQMAEAKVAAQDNQQATNNAQDNQQATDNAVGGTPLNGTSASGGRMTVPNAAPSTCVGPSSYCHIFFGQ